MSKENEFSVAELRRLSEAAGPAEHWGTGDELAAYLGTHRERILAMLVAADALADEADTVVIRYDFDGRDLRQKILAYEAAKEGSDG